MVKLNRKKLFIIPCLISFLLFSGYFGIASGIVSADDNGSVPQVPSAATPSDGTTISSASTTVILEWSASTGATTYRLEINNSPTWDEATRFFYEEVGNVTSKEIDGLPYNETIYYWRVWANDGSGWSESSESGRSRRVSWTT